MVLRLGIVGCGRISNAHGIAVRRLAGAVELAACMDVREEAARKYAETYGVGSVYTDLPLMLRAEHLDGVILATWPGQHLQQIDTVIQGGVRHILCEKALAATANDAYRIWELTAAAGATVLEGFMYAYHPAIAKLDELVASGRGGPIDSLRSVFCNFVAETASADDDKRPWRQRKETGGGVTYDLTCYPVNAVARYARSLPRTVYASGSVSAKYGTINRLFGEITYVNGCVGIVESSATAMFNQEIQINCARRVFRLTTSFTIPGNAIVNEYEAEKFSHVKRHDFPVASALPLQDDLPSFPAYQVQLDHFRCIVQEGATPKLSLAESAVNVHVLEAMVRSLHEHRVIDVAIPDPLARAWQAAVGAEKVCGCER
jgi:predicted dehydrogenase